MEDASALLEALRLRWAVMEVTLVLTLIAILKLSVVEVCSGALAGVATVQVIGSWHCSFSRFYPFYSTKKGA
jgi:hypothetical protein